MTRKTLEYVARAMGTITWETLAVMPLKNALVALDTVMANAGLASQSRSNYRGYLRRLYRFAADEGIDLTTEGHGRFWTAVPTDNGLPRRAQVAYERFVKWAIGHGIWPATVKPEDPYRWALDERQGSNVHWRKDYVRLEAAWTQLSKTDGLPKMAFQPLPARLNEPYGLPVDQWPQHLRAEWDRICRGAGAPLREGGMRPWRLTTQENYERKMALYLGWFARTHADVDLATETWTTLLSATRCREYLNWLVARSGKNHLNPGHPAFLRMVRGFHRFLLGSGQDVIDAFHELTRRCDVQERDKAARIMPYADVEKALEKVLGAWASARNQRPSPQKKAARLASLQVDSIIFGLLATRALRSRNIRGIRIGSNLIEDGDGFVLRFAAEEMKGHRKFETTVPVEVVPVLEEYIHRGFRALVGRAPKDGDVLLRSRNGKPIGSGFGPRVLRLSRRYLGKPVNAHLFRHILATHAAQVLKLTPTELAAFMAHRSPMTVMKYYEVTNPRLAAGRFDGMRNNGLSS